MVRPKADADVKRSGVAHFASAAWSGYTKFDLITLNFYRRSCAAEGPSITAQERRTAIKLAVKFEISLKLLYSAGGSNFNLKNGAIF